MKNLIKQFIDMALSTGFDIIYRRTYLADAYVDYDKGIIVIGNDKEASLIHECLHVLYDEVLNENLSEKNVEKSTRKILYFI